MKIHHVRPHKPAGVVGWKPLAAPHSLLVGGEVVAAESDQLDAPAFELLRVLGRRPQLGGADLQRPARGVAGGLTTQSCRAMISMEGKASRGSGGVYIKPHVGCVWGGRGRAGALPLLSALVAHKPPAAGS